MTEVKEYVIVHTYFLNHSEIRTKKLHSENRDEAYSRAEKLMELDNTSLVKVVQVDTLGNRTVLKVWNSKGMT